MDELTQIRDLLGEPPPPRPGVVTEAHAQLARHARRDLMPRRGRSLAGPVAIGVIAAGTAAALTIMTVLPRGTSSHAAGRPQGAASRPQPSGGRPAGTQAGQSARAFLLAMAVTSLRQQAAGQYWCNTSIAGTREIVGPGERLLPAPWVDGAGDGPAAKPAGYKYAIFTRYRSGTCMVNSGSTAGGFNQALGAKPASTADAAAWRRDGSPDRWRAWFDTSQFVSTQAGPVRTFSGGKPGGAPWGSDASLPADPAKLRAVFLAHPLPYGPSPHPDTSEKLVTAALYVMTGPASNAVRAAAYQVLASVPGIRMRPDVTDPEGQTGTALWGDAGGGPGQLTIVDPATGLVLAYEDIATQPIAGAQPDTVLYYTAFTSAGWTHQPLSG
jgi:hypothetical protein